MDYFVALSASAPLRELERTLHDACAELDVRPVPDSQLREAFPNTENVVWVAIRRVPPDDLRLRPLISPRLVSHRHTPTAVLRRLVLTAARAFGGVRLLVHPAGGLEPFWARPVRRQTTTLAGFLRSGRVVQDGTLLSIEGACASARPS